QLSTGSRQFEYASAKIAIDPVRGGSIGRHKIEIPVAIEVAQLTFQPGDEGELGDLDGDGDLDLVAANGTASNRVYRNLGGGVFELAQLMPIETSRDVALGDLDGDGDLDAFFANENNTNTVWFNDGNGQFLNSGQGLGNNNSSQGVDLGDLDGDGDLDAFVANDDAEPNRIYINNGAGVFTDRGVDIGVADSRAVRLGDLDGDGDLDAFFSNGDGMGQPDQIWFNRACSDVTMEKNGPSMAVAGDPMVYTLIVSNAGSETATGVVATDDLPNGVDWVSDDCGAGPPAGNQLTWNVGSLAPFATATCTVNVVIGPSAVSSITNRASVASVTMDPDLSNNEDDVTTAVATFADLSIVKADSADPVLAGSAMSYTLTVSNAGPSDAQSVQAVDNLPAGVTPSGAQMFNLGRLAANASTSWVIGVSVNSSFLGTLTNNATVTSATTDTNLSNHSVSETTAVNVEADLGVTKTGPATAAVGGMLTYTITVTNRGPGDAMNVVVNDTLPSGLMPSGLVSSNLGTLAAGASVSFNLDASILPSANSAITNVVTVSSPTPDLNPANDADDVVSMITEEADLVLTKSGPAAAQAGTMITYTLAVTNNGPATANGVTLFDFVPIGVTPVSSISTNFGNLLPGQGGVFQVTVMIDATTRGTITNNAQVGSSTSDPDMNNNIASAATVVNADADLTVIKSGPAFAEAGSAIVYNLHLTNAGPADATGVVLSDILPAGVTPTGASNINFATMAAGTVANINIPVTVDPGTSGTITNTVTANSAENDPNPGDNQDAVETVIVSPSVRLIKLSGAALDGTTNIITAGDNVTYTYHVINDGDTFLGGITVTDSVFGLVGLGFAPLAPAATQTFMFVENNVLAGITNLGVVLANPVDSMGIDLPGINNVMDSDDAITQLETARIQLIKRSGNAADGAIHFVPSGTDVDYSFAVVNVGNTWLSDIVVTDNVLGAIGTIAGPVAPGSTNVLLATNMNLMAGVTNLAMVTANPTDMSGTDLPTFADVSDQDEAVTHLSAGGLQLIKLADSAPDGTTNVVQSGSDVTWTYIVINTGSFHLVGLTVTDTVAGLVGISFQPMAPGETNIFTHVQPNLTAGVTNIGVAMALPADSNGVQIVGLPQVRDTDEAITHVISPALDLVKTAGGLPDGRVNFIPAGSNVTY
ncbi:MAG: DUF11 domain-containing protein, partial [Verrucomicrobiota bacterium]